MTSFRRLASSNRSSVGGWRDATWSHLVSLTNHSGATIPNGHTLMATCIHVHVERPVHIGRKATRQHACTCTCGLLLVRGCSVIQYLSQQCSFLCQVFLSSRQSLDPGMENGKWEITYQATSIIHSGHIVLSPLQSEENPCPLLFN